MNTKSKLLTGLFIGFVIVATPTFVHAASAADAIKEYAELIAKAQEALKAVASEADTTQLQKLAESINNAWKSIKDKHTRDYLISLMPMFTQESSQAYAKLFMNATELRGRVAAAVNQKIKSIEAAALAAQMAALAAQTEQKRQEELPALFSQDLTDVAQKIEAMLAQVNKENVVELLRDMSAPLQRAWDALVTKHATELASPTSTFSLNPEIKAQYLQVRANVEAALKNAVDSITAKINALQEAAAQKLEAARAVFFKDLTDFEAKAQAIRAKIGSTATNVMQQLAKTLEAAKTEFLTKHSKALLSPLNPITTNPDIKAKYLQVRQQVLDAAQGVLDTIYKAVKTPAAR
jgi:hypothetical protein